MKIAIFAYKIQPQSWHWILNSTTIEAEVIAINDFSKNLYDYDGVIIFPNAFESSENDRYGEPYLRYDKNINSSRIQEIDHLVRKGGWVCLLEYEILNQWGGYPVHDTDIIKRLLLAFNVRFQNANSPLALVQPTSDNFIRYLKDFGVTKVYYNVVASENYDSITVLAKCGDSPIGFTYLTKYYFLPYNITKFTLGLEQPVQQLVEAILSHRAANEMQLPKWLGEIKFSEEQELEQSILQAEQQLEKQRKRHSAVIKQKGILTAKGAPLCVVVADVLQDYFGLKIDSKDHGAEDIKILDSNGEKVCLIEVKSCNSSVKNDHISQFVSHRIKSGVTTDFPGLLIINSNCKIAGIENRKTQYPAQEQINMANNQGILIVQTIDLLEYMLSVEDLTTDKRAEKFLVDLVGKKGHFVFGRNPKA